MYEIILVLIRNVTLNVNNATNNKEPLSIILFKKRFIYYHTVYIFHRAKK